MMNQIVKEQLDGQRIGLNLYDMKIREKIEEEGDVLTDATC